MIVVVLSVTPEKLRGELTRWLLEIAAGVYVGHVPARVRDRLWARIVEDVGRGRALMVFSRRGEQRLDFRVHHHAWTPEDHDGITLMRRTTAESRGLAATARGRQRGRALPEPAVDDAGDIGGSRGEGLLPEGERVGPVPLGHWSSAGRRRAYRNVVEQRHRAPPSFGRSDRGDAAEETTTPKDE